MYLSSNIPHFEVLVRKEFLYNLESHYGEFQSGVCFGVSSITNRVLGFHVLLDNGAIYWRLPIHALCSNSNAQPIPISDAQLWDNISYHISVTKYEYLKSRDCSFKVRSGKLVEGQYLFTIDYAESEYAESANEHKCSHIISGYDGNFYSMPNNRILWKDSSRIKQEVPDYKVNTHIYCAEETGTAASDDSYFYNFDS